MTNDKYLIMTNSDGFMFANYTTEKLLDYDEALKTLALVRSADQNARLVKVVDIKSSVEEKGA